jgi:hypothetical protein
MNKDKELNGPMKMGFGVQQWFMGWIRVQQKHCPDYAELLSLTFMGNRMTVVYLFLLLFKIV